MELDTHADNTVLGDCCLLIHDTGQKVDVSGFSTALGSIELPIVSGAVIWQGIYLGFPSGSLLSPNG
jgi:hypothetical protein